MTDRRYRRSEAQGIAGRDLGDEYLFYDEADDRVHILNGTARRILLLCDGRRTVADVADVLAREYPIDADTALADTCEIVDRLLDLGLLSAD